MKLQGVIFDMDGTLVNSNPQNTKAWVEAMTEAGFSVTYDQIFALIGMGGDHLLPASLGIEKESEAGEKLSQRWKEIYSETYFPQVKPFPGAKALIERVKADGKGAAIATSSEQEVLERSLRLVGIEALLDAAVSSSDAEHSKPSPDVVLAALKKLGLEASEAILIGDTPFDIKAGKEAGVPVIAFRSGGFSDADLAEAIALYDGAADLLARYETSPLVLEGRS